jgi:ABC-2 type transport system permease protein
MSEIYKRIAGFLIRVSAFIAKEFFSVISQPRLLGVLILGPFLILFIFGISYRDTYRTLRTIIVIPEDSSMDASVRSFAQQPMPGIEVVNITSDKARSMSTLANQLVDLVLVIPPDAVQKIEENQHAVFTFYHQEIDPFEVAYVEIVADRITEETNRELMLSAVEQSQAEARKYKTDIHTLSEFQDETTGSNETDAPREEAALNSLGAPELIWLLVNATGGRADGIPAGTPNGSLASTSSQDSASGSSDGDLQTIDAHLTRFIGMDSQVIVAPFRRETHSLSEADIQPVHFYVPAVLALLLQHIAVSLAGLSIVSERFAGTMELMRAAPVSAFEVLSGKYLSFLVFLGLLAAILTVLVHQFLGVPMIGSWPLYALVICLVILVSLGFGFLISSFARSDSQAIQFAMVLLLASIFFSGFFLQLYRLRWPAQTISWLMPSTYGLKMLQDIMLRGTQPEPWLFWVLGGIATALFMVNWLRLRRLMVQN